MPFSRDVTGKEICLHFFVLYCKLLYVTFHRSPVFLGILNTIEGLYKSPVTGDALAIDEAISKGLISGALLSTRTKRDLLPRDTKETTLTERRCYTITHAKDTVTGEC